MSAPMMWKHLPVEQARRFHDAYVAAHPLRLHRFLDPLLTAGLREIRFESMADVDEVWDFALAHAKPRWRCESAEEDAAGMAWYPLLVGFEVPAGWPVWYQRLDPNRVELWRNLCVEGLVFISGVWACMAEVAVRSWGAQWQFHTDGHSANRTVLRDPRRADIALLESTASLWYAQFGQNPSTRIWLNYERMRNEGPPVYSDEPLPDVEVERFEEDPDEDSPNWFHATISPEFTNDVNTPLIERFVVELMQESAVKEAYRSDTEWVAVQMRRRSSERKVQNLVMAAWERAKLVHPPILPDSE